MNYWEQCITHTKGHMAQFILEVEHWLWLEEIKEEIPEAIDYSVQQALKSYYMDYDTGRAYVKERNV